MPDFDPTRVPVGGTLQGRYTGGVATVATPGTPDDGHIVYLNSGYSNLYVRDPGRHVDHTRTVDDPPRQGTYDSNHRDPHRLLAWERELLGVDRVAGGVHRKPGPTAHSNADAAQYVAMSAQWEHEPDDPDLY